MAPKAKISTKPKEPVKTPVLDDLNIELGAVIRFRLRADENWTTGNVNGDCKDGSLSIIDQYGKWRAIMPENVMLLTRGPRGGRSWTKITSS
jgi:hypothetical protein